MFTLLKIKITLWFAKGVLESDYLEYLKSDYSKPLSLRVVVVVVIFRTGNINTIY